ncbi:GTPase HflX [Geminicoccus roseus]|uniref:GTPase HflX n=1 Tax=Geminicoccus roseus TaxID=404900 RepID=UPI000A06B521
MRTRGKNEPQRDDRVIGNETAEGSGRCLVIHPYLLTDRERLRSPAARLDEAAGLAQAISLDVVDRELAPLRQLTPATLMGEGKVAEIAARVKEDEIDLVVVDGALSPGQQRNLERKWKCKVIDRTGLILEIFGERARTREGVLQVDLAALNYQKSRLVRSWTHLERQRGGAGFLGGPGESQLELDRRIIADKIVKLERELADVKRTRSLHRRARERVPYPVVALVGYTNAGKSTLFNSLTGSEVFAKDLLFATLDPTMRLIRLPHGRKVILSDTVGFISELPTSLVAAFRATLEEVLSADVVLHVRDVAHEDTRAQDADVRKVLDELGIDEMDRGRRMIEVWNKIDLFDAERRATLEPELARSPDTVAVSAWTGEGQDRLLQAIEAKLAESAVPTEVVVPHEDGETLAWLFRNGEVLAKAEAEDGTHLSVLLADDVKRRLEARLAPPG